MSAIEPRTITLHGRPLSYVQAGSGPVLLLIHGIAGNFENWREGIEPLARRHTVGAPDLPGHGRRAPRAAALPGANLFIGATAALGSTVGTKVARGLAVAGLRPDPDVAEVARGYASLVDRERRRAFLATLHGVIGTGGQRVNAGDRLYLAEGMPV